jgi:hypothetical protein
MANGDKWFCPSHNVHEAGLSFDGRCFFRASAAQPPFPPHMSRFEQQVYVDVEVVW